MRFVTRSCFKHEMFFGRDLDILKVRSTCSFKLIFPVKGTSKDSSGFKVLGSWIRRSVLQLKTTFFLGGLYPP